MISSDHGTAEITHFLNKWVLTCQAVLHKYLKIEHIEMDHSWAIMHSTCLAFNRLSISLYLTQCWEIVNNKTTIKSDKILEYILTYYMPLLSLWSGIILSKVNINGISTDSNAEVENWFKIVKHCIY